MPRWFSSCWKLPALLDDTNLVYTNWDFIENHVLMLPELTKYENIGEKKKHRV